MLILGIETSCDETALALVEGKQDKLEVIKNTVASQISIHKKYGGVIPEVAARQHTEVIAPLLQATLGQKKPDAIAVTAGPGLAIALLVGVEVARTLSYLWQKPLIAVNHLAGHIYANWLPDLKTRGFKLATQNKNLKSEIKNLQFPMLCLIVSGGHTELILMRGHLNYKIIGRTRDDAAGECFDKVAKILGLPYPGGPSVAALAANCRLQIADCRFETPIKFPRPMLNEKNFDFSFSGLKTAVLYYVKEHYLEEKIPPKELAKICYSFEDAVTEVLVAKTLRAAKKYQVKTVLLGGGVSANHRLRQQLGLAVLAQLPNTRYKIPDTKYTTDNAAMIAAAGYFQALKKDFTPWQKIEINPQLTLSRA